MSLTQRAVLASGNHAFRAGFVLTGSLPVYLCACVRMRGYHPIQRPYYFNPSLQLSQWEKPEALAWTQKHATKFFWHNTVTDEVQWETPPDARLKSDEHPGQYYHVVNGEATWESPHGWEVVFDDKYGQEYYRNTKSDESSWVKPAELGWVKVHVDYDHSEL